MALRSVRMGNRGQHAMTDKPSATPYEPHHGTVKILAALVDRAYKIFVMSGMLRAAEQDPDSNDPIVAWASDVRSILYRNHPPPDAVRDLQRVK